MNRTATWAVANAAALNIGILAFFRAARQSGWIEASANTENWVYSLGAMAAAATALALCTLVAADYRQGSFLRLAWILVSGDAFMSFFRFALDGPLGLDVWSGPSRFTTRMVLVVAGLLCVLAGMWAMAWGFHRLRLGFQLLRRDQILMAVLTAGMLLTLAAGMQRGRSAIGTVAVALIFVSAIASVMLGRFSAQMEGGQISKVIWSLLVYMAIRCVMNFLLTFRLAEDGAAATVFLGMQAAMPWLLALTAALRYDVVLQAARNLEKMRREIAGTAPAVPLG